MISWTSAWFFSKVYGPHFPPFSRIPGVSFARACDNSSPNNDGSFHLIEPKALIIEAPNLKPFTSLVAKPKSNAKPFPPTPCL